ncbi:Beta-lactamase-related domain-containing protein [Bordetella sputigena]|uniref:serine hydrolase domain-containing protein n=1 Tax=Bordetella sputigena TaxID=1416810 RepID=UPI0039F0B0DE
MLDIEHIIQEATRERLIPGVSLATLRNGERDITVSCGIRGARDPSSVDAETVFEAASLTKPVVAYLVLQLVEQGLLDLHRPLVDICGEHIPADPRSRRISAFHVLTHTSGLPNIVRPEAPLRTYFDPGERFSYGSSAFAWLQKAMETITGYPLAALAQERVFQPLAMLRSSLAWHEDFEHNHAQGHEWDGEPVPKRRHAAAQASWSLVTTASDYIAFVQHVLSQGGGLSASTYDAWFIPRVNTRQGDNAEDLPGVNPIDPHVAWGLGVGLEPAETCFFHWGNSPGFRALVVANRTTRDAVAWFTNSARGLRIAHSILPATVPGDHPCLRWLGIGPL